MIIPDDVLLKTLWNYLTIESLLLPADVIIVGGENDPGLAGQASDLYKQGFAPLIVFSGYQQPGMDETEAKMLSRIAEQRGVPTSAILREELATNTGENITLSAAVLKTQGIHAERVILVHKPYMTRRFLATAEVQWPDPKPSFMVSHQVISIDNYYLKLGRGEVIRKMLGDFKRINTYAKKGFQTPQVIPEEVQTAYDLLVARGHQVR